MSNNRGGVRAGAGRPKGSYGAYKEVIKLNRVTVRLSPEETKMLEECMEALNKKKSATILTALKHLHDTINK